jgi:hypothetical protein
LFVTGFFSSTPHFDKLSVNSNAHWLHGGADSYTGCVTSINNYFTFFPRKKVTKKSFLKSKRYPHKPASPPALLSCESMAHSLAPFTQALDFRIVTPMY